MKKKLFLCMALMLFTFMSCRKETDRVLPDTAEVHPAHCFNFVKDGDEIYVDCGGSCEACEVNVLTIPCTTTMNKDSIENYPVQTFTNISCGIVEEQYKVIASNSTIMVTLTFPYSTISPNQIYYTTGSPYDSDEVKVSVVIDAYTYYALDNAKVYCTKQDGKYVFDFCEMHLYTYQFAPYDELNMTGNITCN